MLIGKYTHGLDAKGRIILPAEFREYLGSVFFMTQGYERCLFVYPQQEWEKFMQRLLALPQNDKNAQRVLRTFTECAVRREADKQGRVILPQELRDYAGIVKDVVSIGAITRVEIWGSEAWKEYKEEAGAMSFEEAVASLPQLS